MRAPMLSRMRTRPAAGSNNNAPLFVTLRNRRRHRRELQSVSADMIIDAQSLYCFGSYLLMANGSRDLFNQQVQHNLI